MQQEAGCTTHVAIGSLTADRVVSTIGWSGHNCNIVATNMSFVATNTFLLQQTYFCCDKHNLVVKTFVTTSLLLLQQTCFCCDKTHLLLQQNFVVATNIIICCGERRVLLQQKVILRAAPTNDKCQDQKENDNFFLVSWSADPFRGGGWSGVCVCGGGGGAKVYTDNACWRDVQQMQ